MTRWSSGRRQAMVSRGASDALAPSVTQDGPLTRFAALVALVVALEFAAFLWITGALRPL